MKRLSKAITPVVPGLKKVMVGPLEPPNTEPSGLLVATALDTVWLSSYSICDPLKCPSWSGFNHSVITQGEFVVRRINVLPFINHNPSQLDTIYAALCFAQKLTETYNLGVSPVTFDKPLYAKAPEIGESSSNLPNIFIRLGGFHLLMSYLGSIEDQMPTLIYDKSKYPKFYDLDNSGYMVSEHLLHLLSRIITSRKSKRRVISLSHGITAAAQPRSFISPISLAISVYIN